MSFGHLGSTQQVNDRGGIPMTISQCWDLKATIIDERGRPELLMGSIAHYINRLKDERNKARAGLDELTKENEELNKKLMNAYNTVDTLRATLNMRNPSFGIALDPAAKSGEPVAVKFNDETIKRDNDYVRLERYNKLRDRVHALVYKGQGQIDEAEDDLCLDGCQEFIDELRKVVDEA